MEAPPKDGKFPLQRVRDSGLLGCFLAPRLKRQAPSSPDRTSVSSKEDFFSSDDPDLVDPLFTTADSTSCKSTSCSKSSRLSDNEATGESFVFSLPAPSDPLLEYPSFRTLSDPLLSTFSYNSGVHVETSKRGASFGSFGGHPHPLPPPLPKAVSLPLPTRNDSAPEHRLNSGSFVSTSSDVTATRQESEVGSWSTRRGRAAAPVFGLPLPSPSVATKLMPGLESFEFEDLLQGSREFSPECCMEKGAFGAVYRTWVPSAGEGGQGRQMAVVRLNVNENQILKDWKSDVQMLAQLPDSNICLIKGYCEHEDVDVHSVKIVSERLLVFEQSPNGTLHDYLCGSRSETHLDWSARISIVLGAARGLMYLHDRAPLQIVYRKFKSSSVLLDKDHTPRLAGYGLAVTSSSADRKSSLLSVMKTSQAYAKSNVWSFGVVLLELLTGKCSLDATFHGSEKNFVRWAKPFLKDELKLAQVLDPRLKPNCPLKAACKVAVIALRCLKTKELQRPTMSRVVVALKSINDDSCCGRAHHYGGRAQRSSSAVTSLEQQQQQQRRASFGGLSFRALQQRSKAGDILVLPMTGRPSIFESSEDNQSMAGSVTRFCNCAMQSGKVVDNAKTSSYRVF